MLSTFLLASASALSACPWLAEIHPDPTPLDDRLGEFIELRIPEGVGEVSVDSITLWFDNTPIGSASWPAQASRVIFCHTDSLRLLPEHPVPCRSLRASLPNSRPLQISLSSGFCRDTAWLEPAKAGKSWQRESIPPAPGSWALSSPSPGFAQPALESGVRNAWPSIISTGREESIWDIRLTTQGSPDPTSDTLWLEWFDIAKSHRIRVDTLEARSSELQIQGQEMDPPWVFLRLRLAGDDFPLDNQALRTLFPPGLPPLAIKEVNACPNNGEPEWLEIQNQTGIPIPLHAISHCREMAAVDSSEFLPPGGIALITDHTDKLRTLFPGLEREIILPSAQSLGLSNVRDTARLCLWGQVVDSLAWGAPNPTPCAAPSPSPGFIPNSGSAPSNPQLYSRVVAKSGATPLRIQVPPGDSLWKISIIHNSGQILLKERELAAGLFTWMPPPRTKLGPCLIVGVNGSRTWRSSFVLVQ